MQNYNHPAANDRGRRRAPSRARRQDERRPELSSSTELVVYNPTQNQLPVSRPEPKRVKIRAGDIRQTYKVLPIVIGTGAFGTVRSCIHRSSKTKLAIKSIKPKGSDDPNHATLLNNEIAILGQMNHAHVVKVVDVIRDNQYIHIIMEQCRGGDLFDVTLDDRTRLGETKIRKIIGSLLDAIAYMHERNIVHRDLKADHLMFSRQDTNSCIKIIDFGVATFHKQGDAPMTAFAGSLRSIAPEVIKRSYGREVDLWSTGIITYFLLMQEFPFDSPTCDQKEIFSKILSGRYFYPQWAATGVSAEAKDFIARLLVVDPRRRLTAKQALMHPWIRGAKRGAVQKQSRGRPKSQARTTSTALVVRSTAKVSPHQRARSKSAARARRY